MATPTVSTLPAAIGPIHPLYSTYAPFWRQLADVAEGSGGFLDGTYLIPHPREWKDHDQDRPVEPSKKLIERRQLARYEALAGLVLTQKLSALFRQPPTRRVLNPQGAVIDEHPYLAWTENVDGAGRSFDQWLRDTYRQALIFGHEVIVLDRTRDAGQTAADASPLQLRAYTPLDVPDWLTDATGRLTAVKVVEALPRTSLGEHPAGSTIRYRVLEITAEAASQYDTATASGAPAVRAEKAHGFGALPVVLLYAHRRAVTPVLGLSALSDPQLYIDLYNLTSEIRELLRKQTFSFTNLPLGTGPDRMSVQDAQEMAGQTTGTSNVLFSGLPAQVLSADTDNVTVYQAEREALIKTILRLCSIPYDQDGRDAESAESRRLKRADFNTALAGYADELQLAEMGVARLWYRGTYGERWEQEWERATPEIHYPQTFEETPFADILEQAQAVLALPLGESKTFRTEHTTRLIGHFLPDAPPETVDAIRAEIEALPTPEEQRAQRLEDMGARLQANRPGTPAPAADPDDEAV
jgi:hypothetical protein